MFAIIEEYSQEYIYVSLESACTKIIFNLGRKNVLIKNRVCYYFFDVRILFYHGSLAFIELPTLKVFLYI